MPTFESGEGAVAAMKPEKRKSAADQKAVYKPSERERLALLKQIERSKGEPTVPRIKVVTDGKVKKILPDHADAAVAGGLLLEALGTADADFAQGILEQLIRAATHGGKINERELNFMFSIVKGIKPTDQLETMLATQMASVHVTAMRSARHFSMVETLPQQDSADRVLNKIMRTFIMQMEALKRHWTGGEQKVTVQHVSVSEGGQAIVGNVTQSVPGAASKKSRRSRPALTDARQPAMPIIENPVGTPVAAKTKK